MKKIQWTNPVDLKIEFIDQIFSIHTNVLSSIFRHCVKVFLFKSTVIVMSMIMIGTRKRKPMKTI